MRTLIGTP
ncbi:hypothetical protein GB937_010928 [Aspergillus fischeri]|nr:hypothetical protein GB937_010928 [Aspergillus fischeri]